MYALLLVLRRNNTVIEHGINQDHCRGIPDGRAGLKYDSVDRPYFEKEQQHEDAALREAARVISEHGVSCERHSKSYRGCMRLLLVRCCFREIKHFALDQLKLVCIDNLE